MIFLVSETRQYIYYIIRNEKKKMKSIRRVFIAGDRRGIQENSLLIFYAQKCNIHVIVVSNWKIWEKQRCLCVYAYTYY